MIAAGPVRLSTLQDDLEWLSRHPDLPPCEHARYYESKLQWVLLQRRIAQGRN